METASLSVGCLIGILVNFGFAILFAIYGVSFWWLLPIAFIANLFAQPLGVRNDILERALKDGRFLRANFTIWIFPTFIWFAIQSAIYRATVQIIQ